MESEDGKDACLVATLGMFIIDTFRFEDEQTGECRGDGGFGEQVGGGGTYFAVGARVWLDPRSILMIVDRGDDFDPSIQRALDVYAATQEGGGQGHALWHFRPRPGERTTRAVNIYKGELRGFAYLTPKRRLDPVDLLCKADERLQRLPVFIHCICSPDRARQIVEQIDSLEAHWPLHMGTTRTRRPRLIWEPIPDSAIHDNLEEAIDVSGRVAVLSPNHKEAASFLGLDVPDDVEQANLEGVIEDVARQLHDRIVKLHNHCPVICIRSGAMGALICLPDGQVFWTPAYHSSSLDDVSGKNDHNAKVKDVTGAGNAWLGGFVAGLASQPHCVEDDQWSPDQVKLASQMASVSASFTVEQLGLPLMTTSGSSVTWNDNEVPSDRLQLLQGRQADRAL